MATWLEHSVHTDVEVPMELVWSLWSDLEQMPRWMKWIDSVKVLKDQPELSRWTLNTTGWEFTWLSRTLKVVPRQIIQWESVDGLPNRGAIRFYDHKTSSTVKMTISYAVPGFLSLLMNSSFIDRVVTSTLQADLERFREYALAAQKRELANSETTV
ncbi:SRPBCC family protein [Romeria aff. gracilis LEGE 07310]|uniref:SRPBCC family protein n=1 Tax=Vasconcelosia minhoensis LEGE 07310 TaxID=915328 RepID=A0A8J7AMM5_9CYAN|nr:SRPBCC family protein [Romeria gracilis]MBE9077259.1 SRPBCC family protein [Romeria aff. gracilis LEGE 07310]